MSSPCVVAVAPGSPAEDAGVVVGDEIVALNRVWPRDLIEYRLLADEPEVTMEVRRGDRELRLDVVKGPGEPLGVEVHSAVFDRVRTCDNHCEFCFVHQLPPGLRPGLYVKDDDYRLSFLYGNYTTLTRFTDADLERVVSERLSPLNVSIHATDPEVRAGLLRNRRAAGSLRWLRALLDHGIEVHGQVVVCPGINDGPVLEDTMAGVLDGYPELASLCLVPVGVSRHATEPRLRPHTAREAATVVDTVEDWQGVFRTVLGRRMVFAADEYYLLADRPFPAAEEYEGFPMYEDGVGMARLFEEEFTGRAKGTGAGSGDTVGGTEAMSGSDGPPIVLTGRYGAAVIEAVLARSGRRDVRVVAVDNRFFGGNVGVTGLLTGEDLARVLGAEPGGHRYLLADVCLSGGRFLDGARPSDLPRQVQIVGSDGWALRAALGG